jgi:hypothetical protein
VPGRRGTAGAAGGRGGAVRTRGVDALSRRGLPAVVVRCRRGGGRWIVC